MTRQAKQNLKTAAILLGSAAVIAGLIYYFKDNEDVKEFLADAKEKGADAWDKTKEYLDDTVKKARKTAEEYV